MCNSSDIWNLNSNEKYYIISVIEIDREPYIYIHIWSHIILSGITMMYYNWYLCYFTERASIYTTFYSVITHNCTLISVI